jgi:hypothetical protein
MTRGILVFGLLLGAIASAVAQTALRVGEQSRRSRPALSPTNKRPSTCIFALA